jgi:hypothetical protein
MSDDGFTESYDQQLRNIKILDLTSVVSAEAKETLQKNSDVALWLSKVGFQTRPGYVRLLAYFLKCVNLTDPTELLDLKGHEDVKQRFFPAEKLVEVWMARAREKGLSNAKIKRALDTVRSFYKHSRIPLVQVKFTYKPRPKNSISDEELRAFREGFNWYGKILFDFLLSVPLRDGQFQKCPNCHEEFFPRWRDIQTYPDIKAYSTFIIKPQKGHENEQYSTSLRQVCFLTESAAVALRGYRDYKEKMLGRQLRPEEYIFTHQKNHLGARHVAPVTKMTIITFFQHAAARSGVKISPHMVRTWVNSVLASRGIDKQLRDMYLGHSCTYEEGYVMQLLPKLQQSFRQARAMEHLDLNGNRMSAEDVEDTLFQVEEQKKEIARLRRELEAKTLRLKRLEHQQS